RLEPVEGLSYEAAAEVIGCPPGTVKSRVSRARDRLVHDLDRPFGGA
ncbi:ECF subfamily RNA polymerase sigma-24 factor, partial [Methylobacterium tarhaniae]